MIQQPLNLDAENVTARTARYLVQTAGRWLTSDDLMPVAGKNAWRTELSRCRSVYGMRTQNRVTRDSTGKVLTSEYRLTDAGWYPVRRGQEGQAA